MSTTHRNVHRCGEADVVVARFRSSLGCARVSGAPFSPFMNIAFLFYNYFVKMRYARKYLSGLFLRCSWLVALLLQTERERE
jgi:hypothetical protein